MPRPDPLLDATIVRQLHELADTPFELRAFRDRWEAFGWAYEPSDVDRYGFHVRISDRRWLLVDPLGEEVLCASMPLYFWERYEPEWHEERAEYEQQRRAYDAMLDAAAATARRELPPPATEWTDADADAHRAIVWDAKHGLLVLQQAAFDLQYGFEINFWLARCAKEQFQPTTPLIDWLCQLSRREHEARGFPPLPW